MNPTLQVTGRHLTVSEATRRRNPGLYRPIPSTEVQKGLQSSLAHAAGVNLGTPEVETDPGEPSKSEKALHAQILAYCQVNGWLVLHGSMAHRTRRTEGEPDFTVLLPGRVLFVEAKTGKGKLSPAQVAFAAKAEALGHKVHVARGFIPFRNLTETTIPK